MNGRIKQGEGEGREKQEDCMKAKEKIETKREESKARVQCGEKIKAIQRIV